MRILICTLKPWNVSNAQRFRREIGGAHDVRIATCGEEMGEILKSGFDPSYIFFPHWSSLIPEEVYVRYECIVFHIADLPYGRGGSPLQNLITRGVRETALTAFRVDGGIDTGPVYMKVPFSLYGTADEMLMRASEMVFSQMIPKIIEGGLVPVPQEGEVLEFRRRRLEDSEMPGHAPLEKVFDHIRMLDGEGYPKAYLVYGGLRFEFSRASLKDERVIADVTITEEDNG